MAAGEVNLPPGFQLEGGPQLPHGFKLEQPQEPSLSGAVWDQIKQQSQSPMAIFPQYWAVKGMEAINKGIEHGAYRAGGAITDALAKLPSGTQDEFGNRLTPEDAAALGYLTNVGVQSIPVVAGAYLSSKGGQQKMESLSRDLMNRAIKPNAYDARTGNAQRAIETALNQGRNATLGSVETAEKEANALHKLADRLVASSNKEVPIEPMGQKYLGQYEGALANPTEPEQLAAVQKVWKNFVNSPAVGNQDAVSVQLANRLKEGIREGLKYGEKGSMTEESQKAISRFLREGVAAEHPEVASTLAKEGELRNFIDVVKPRALAAANRDPGGGFSWLTDSLGKALGFLLLRDPLSKSLAARALYQGSETIPTAAGGVAGAALANQLRQPPPE